MNTEISLARGARRRAMRAFHTLPADATPEQVLEASRKAMRACDKLSDLYDVQVKGDPPSIRT